MKPWARSSSNQLPLVQVVTSAQCLAFTVGAKRLPRPAAADQAPLLLVLTGPSSVFCQMNWCC